MKIALFSNFLNHHVLPLCLALHGTEGVEFRFVACEKIPDDRLSMGYADMNTAYPFIVRAYEDSEAANAILDSFDAVILGAVPTDCVARRMKTGKLTFRFCERSLKKGTWRRFIPTTQKKIYDGYTRYKNAPLYVLGASSYTASDLALCGFDRRKCFRFGYFPAVILQDVDALFLQKRRNSVPEILYAGRLLSLKRVMDTVRAVHALKTEGVPVHFTVIGEGEAESEIRAYIEKHSLSDVINLLPFTTPEKVREAMDAADIFVFSSNFYEGWGAVVNESMNSACATVVSHAVGSAAFLIENGKNGEVYPMGNVPELTAILRRLAQNPDERETLGRNAYRTVTGLWSAEIAAARLLTIIDTLMKGESAEDLYVSGPGASEK